LQITYDILIVPEFI